MSAGFAVPAAVTYGLADFAGGLASRRSSVLTVTLVAQVAGLVVLLPTLLLVPGSFTWRAALLGAVAAIGGTSGLDRKSVV